MSILDHMRARATSLASASDVNGPCQAMVSRTGRFQFARPLSISYSASNTNHIVRSTSHCIGHTTLTDARASPRCEAKARQRHDAQAARHTAALVDIATDVATDVALLSPLTYLE